jgi:hypothetical protein
MSAFLSVGVDGAGNVYPATLTAYPATAASGVGANLTLDAQNAATGVGGNVVLNGGTGTTTPGYTIFQSGGSQIGSIQEEVGTATQFDLYLTGSTAPSASNPALSCTASTTVVNASSIIYFQIGRATTYIELTSSVVQFAVPIQGGISNPLRVVDASITLATSGTTTISAGQKLSPSLTIAAVTLVGAATLAFGNIGGAVGTSSAIFFLDISGINASSLATYGLTLTNGTGTITLTSTQIAAAGGLIIVKCNTNAITIG